MHAEVLQGVELSHLGCHGLAGEPSAHLSGFGATMGIIGPTGGVVAALPADGDGGVVAECPHTYNVKVSMHAA